MQTRFQLRHLFLLVITLSCTVAFLATNNFFSSFFHIKPSDNPDVYPAIIIGGGIGGLTTGLHLAQNGCRPLVLEGNTPGGLLTLSHSVRNWPGVKNSPGEKLVAEIRSHAHNSGAQIQQQAAASINCSTWPYTVTTTPDVDGNQVTYKTTSIVIATGTTPRKLSIPGEETYWGKGVSNCAVCDGGLYKNKSVALIGGGEAAIEEAEYLSTLASNVYMIIRKPTFTSHEASRIQAVSNNPKITIHFNSIPTEIEGNHHGVTSLKVKNTSTGEESSLSVKGVFEAIGSTPNTSICKDIVEVDAQGYIRVDQFGTTSQPGFFAVGDATPTRYRQAIIVAEHAAKTALAATNYIIKSKRHHHDVGPSLKENLVPRTILPTAPTSSYVIDSKAHPDAHAAIIVGGGSAGLTTAIYLGYAGYKPLLFEGGRPGGSLNHKNLINSWPTQSDITGHKLAMEIRQHALEAGARIDSAQIASIDYSSWPYEVTTAPDAHGKIKKIQTLSIIIAAGAPTASNALLQKGLQCNPSGHASTTNSHETSLAGVYAIGDCVAPTYNQPLIGAGQGSEAALNACQFLRSTGYQQHVSPTKHAATAPTAITPAPIQHKKPSEVPHLVTIKDFNTAINSGKNVLIDCFAQWCPPCKRLKPVLQKIYSENTFPDVSFYAVDVDEAEDLARFLSVQSLPTLIFLSNKKEVSREMGFSGEAWLHKIIATTFKKP